jgi:hypothetical protein
MEKKTTFLAKNREAMGDNGASALNIDGARAGVIYAYIDEQVRAEINEQLAKTEDTSDVIGPHRTGRAVDCVTFNASLREILTAEPIRFEHETEIDAWVAELENLAQGLREFKARRRQEAAGISCKHCPHSLLDHERADSGELRCQYRDCDCGGFFPIEPETLN